MPLWDTPTLKLNRLRYTGTLFDQVQLLFQGGAIDGRFVNVSTGAYEDISVTPSTPASEEGYVGTLLDFANDRPFLAPGPGGRPIFREDNGKYVIGDGQNDALIDQGAYSGWGDVFIGAAFQPRGVNNYGRLIDGTYNTGFMLARKAQSSIDFGGGCVEPNPPYGQYKVVTPDTDYVISMVRSGASTTMRLDGKNPTVRGTSAAAMYGTLALLNDAGLGFESAHRLYSAIILVKSVTDGERQLCEQMLASTNSATL